jgi:hypothetical protein
MQCTVNSCVLALKPSISCMLCESANFSTQAPIPPRAARARTSPKDPAPPRARPRWPGGGAKAVGYCMGSCARGGREPSSPARVPCVSCPQMAGALGWLPAPHSCIYGGCRANTSRLESADVTLNYCWWGRLKVWVAQAPCRVPKSGLSFVHKT